MAKKVIEAVVAIYNAVKKYMLGMTVDAPLADIYWPEKRNIRDALDYGSKRDNVALAFELRTGFDKTHSSGILQACEPDGKHYSVEMLTEMRRKDWQKFLQDANQPGAPELALRLLEAFEFYYVREEKGVKDVIQPRLIGDEGYRRSECYEMSYVAALYPHLLMGDKEMTDLGVKPLTEAPSHHIFVNIVPFRPDDDENLIQDQLRENSTETKVALSENSWLTIGHRLYKAGVPQIKFRNLMKAGTGQKHFRLQTLNAMPEYRKVQLYKRCLEGHKTLKEEMAKPSKDRKKLSYFPNCPIDPQVLDKEDLKVFIDFVGKDAPNLAKSTFPLRDCRIDAEALERYIAIKMSGIGVVTPKAMKPDEIERIANGSSENPYVSNTARAILTNKGTVVSDMTSPLENQCLAMIYDLRHNRGDDLVEPLKLLTRYYEKVTGEKAEDVAEKLSIQQADAIVLAKKADVDAQEQALEELSEAEPEEIEMVTASGRGRKKK
jgi:hypothetical protein